MQGHARKFPFLSKSLYKSISWEGEILVLVIWGKAFFIVFMIILLQFRKRKKKETEKRI